jgi:hypothetical protein
MRLHMAQRRMQVCGCSLLWRMPGSRFRQTFVVAVWCFMGPQCLISFTELRAFWGLAGLC